MVIRALSLCLASRCCLVSSWLLANLDALRDARRCRSRNCTLAGLYISRDAVLARPYLYTITHCCPSDVTISPVTVHRRQSYQTAAAALSRLPVFRTCLPLSPSTIFVLSFVNRLSQYRGYPNWRRRERNSSTF